MSDAWDGFFSALASVAITAFALLFATLQLRSSTWKSSKLKTMAAISALSELLIPALLSLITLMPGQPWRWACWVTGTSGLLVLARHLMLYKRTPGLHLPFDRKQVVYGIPASTIVYGSLVGFAFAKDTWAPYVIGSLCVWLLFSGSSEAWLLLDV